MIISLEILRNELRKINKNFNSNETKHALFENKLNEISKKVKAISTKLLKFKFSTLNRAKCFFSGIFQN